MQYKPTNQQEQIANALLGSSKNKSLDGMTIDATIDPKIKKQVSKEIELIQRADREAILSMEKYKGIHVRGYATT